MEDIHCDKESYMDVFKASYQQGDKGKAGKDFEKKYIKIGVLIKV